MLELIIKTILSMTPAALSRKFPGEFVPVFMLHRIIDSNCELDMTQANLLRRYLEYIRKNNYYPIALEDLFMCIAKGGPLPEKSVSFTVDDGFADQFELLAPIFSEYDIPLTCFVITGLLDGILWPWDDQIKYVLSTTRLKSFTLNLLEGDVFTCNLAEGNLDELVDNLRFRLKAQNQTHLYDWLQILYTTAEVEIPVKPPPQYRAGSWEQANEFVRNGHAVAPHTRTHRILSRLSDSEVGEEIIGSQQYLKTKVPGSVDIFAYPTGRLVDFGEREQNIVMDSPMMGAVSAVADAVRSGCRIDALPRFGLPNNMGDFLQYLSFIEVLKNKLRGMGPG